MPISGKDMCKLFQKAGYEIVPGGVKEVTGSFKEKGVQQQLFQITESSKKALNTA